MATASATQVILTGENDWDLWIEIIKTTALGYEIWEAIDPDLDTEVILGEPAPPDHDAPDYIVLVEHWRRGIRSYDTQKKGMVIVRGEIQKTVAKNLLHHTFNCTTVRDILRKLQQRCAPTAEVRKEGILGRYNRLREPNSSRGVETETWLAEWEDVVAAGQRISLPDTATDRTIKDFLKAVPDTGFSDYWYNRIEDQGVPEGMDFYGFLQRYRQHRTLRDSRESKAIRAGVFHTHGPTLGGYRRDGTYEKSKCLCGEDHRFVDCPYLIPGIRTEGWQPDPKIQESIDQKLERSSRLRLTIQGIQERAKPIREYVGFADHPAAF